MVERNPIKVMAEITYIYMIHEEEEDSVLLHREFIATNSATETKYTTTALL